MNRDGLCSALSANLEDLMARHAAQRAEEGARPAAQAAVQAVLYSPAKVRAPASINPSGAAYALQPASSASSKW